MKGRHSAAAGFSSRLITDDYLGVYRKNIQVFHLGYTFSGLTSKRFRQFSANWSRSFKGDVLNDFFIRFADAFSIRRTKARGWNVYAGYAISGEALYFKQQNVNGTKHSWATITSMSLFGINSYAWGVNNVYLKLALPLAGFGSRPSGDKIYNENGHAVLYNSLDNLTFISWHNFRAFDIDLEFTTRINHKWEALAGYKQHFKLYKGAMDFTEQSNGFQIGLSYLLQ